MRSHGLEEGTEWGHLEICPMWEEYGNESKSYHALQDVFQSQYTAGISIETGFQTTPHLPASSCRDIKKGNFAPPLGQLSYNTCDIGLLPLAFSEMSAAEKVAEDIQEE